MKTLTTLILFVFAANLPLFAQSTLERAGGTSNDESMDVATDAAGNIYSCGYISNFVTFGNVTVDSPQGQSDIYVAKQSPNGTFLWVKRFAGTKDERAYDIYVDAVGMIYITGYFYGTTHFDTISISSNNNTRDMFIAKLDNNGNVLWVKDVGGPDGDTGYGICSDSQGNVIVTGQFREQITLGANTYTTPLSSITNFPTFDLILIKYDSNGNLIWSKTGTSDGENRGLAVVCNSDDEILLTGQFSDTMTLAGVLFNNNGYNLGMVAKFSTSGNLDWMRKMVASQTMAYDLAVNSAKEIYITGDFKGNGFTFIDNGGNHYLSSIYLYNIFVVKINNNGAYIWGETDGSHNEVTAQGIDLDNAENPYICGLFKCKFGEYSDALSADSGYFYSMGYRDVFLTKYDSQGQRQWMQHLPGPKDDYCSGISVSTPNNPVFSGSFERLLFVQTNGAIATNDQSTVNIGNPCSGFSPVYRLNSIGSIDNKDIFVGRINASALAPLSYFSPICSQFYLPEITSDTISFCVSGSVCVNDHANNSYGFQPIFQYLWSNNSVNQCSGLSYSNANLTVNIERADQCYENNDSVHIVIHPLPQMPSLSDDFIENSNTTSYNDVTSCFPDTVTFWFSNIDTNNTYNYIVNGISHNINDTVTKFNNASFGVSVTSPFGCANLENFGLNLLTVDTPVVIQPYLRLVDLIDMNDSIKICPGVEVVFIGKDSLTTSGAYFDPYCFNYGLIDQIWTASYNNNPIALSGSQNCLASGFTPQQTGWYTIRLEIITGGMNMCGIDTIHMVVEDSFYIEIVPAPNIQLHADSITCPGNIAYAWADTIYAGLSWTAYPIGTTVLPGGDSIAVNNQGHAFFGGNFIYQNDVMCALSSSVYIDFYENPVSISGVPDGIICPNDSILLTCQPGLQYEWIGPQGNIIDTTQSVYVHVPGYYHCNQTNLAGCLLPSNFIEIKGYATPILTVSPDAYLCPGETADIAVTTVGTPSFNWVNPAGYSSSDLTVNQPGVYVCQITQCGFTISDTAEIFDASFAISLNNNGDTTICYGDSIMLMTNPSYGGYQWSIDNNSSYFNFASQNGDYFVSAINTYGCVAQSDTFSLHINPGSLPPPVFTPTICEGDDAYFIYSDTNNVYWYKDSLGMQLIGVTDTFMISPLNNDTTLYLLQYNGICQSEITPAHVHISNISNGINILGDTVVCFGASIALSGPADGNSLWSGPNGFSSTQDNIAISNANPASQEGYYELTVTEGNCQKTDSILVDVLSPLNNALDTSGVLTICPGSAIVFGVLDTSYQISWDSSGIQTPNITVNEPGLYFATLTDSFGCFFNTDTVTVAFFQNTAPVLSDTSICYGINYSFNDTSAYQLSWFDTDSMFIVNENLLLNNMTNDSSFLYQYIDTNLGCNNGMSLFTIHVMPPNPPLIMGDSLICANTNALFETSYTTDGQSAWSVNDTMLLVGDSCFFNIPVDTSFYLVLTTTGSVCSNGTDSVLVNIVLPISPALNDSSLVFCGTTAAVWTINNPGTYTANWETDMGIQNTGDTLNLLLNQTIFSSGFVYFVDTNACRSNSTYFTAEQAIQATYDLVQAATTCVGDTIVALGYSQDAANSYWSTPNGIVQGDTVALYGIQLSNSGDYIFTVIDSSSCISQDTFQLDVATPIGLNLGNDTVLCSGEQISVSSPQGDHFFWSNGSGLQTQVITQTEVLVLTVWTGTYCPSTDTVSIQFTQCMAVAPNVVTANGDGQNDLFKIKDAQYLFDDYIVIKNRWGDVVYETHEYKNDFNAAVYDLDEGVYFYVYYETWKPKDETPLTGFFHVYR